MVERSQGTHASDGFRSGPIFPKNSAPGSKDAPWAVYDVAPQASAVNNIVLEVVTPGAGTLTLAAGAGTTFVQKFGLSNVIELDVPRVLSVTLANAGAVGTTLFTGYDDYFNPLQEQVTSIAGRTVLGKKAFKWLVSATYSAASVSALSIGTGDIIGLPWRVDSSNYLTINYDVTPGNPYTFPFTETLTLAAGTATFAAPYVDDVSILVSRFSAGGVLGNLTVELTVNDNPALNTITVHSTSATDTSVVTVSVAPHLAQIVFTPAYQEVDGDGKPTASTLTSEDIRGTISVKSIGGAEPFNGVCRVTVFAYILGSDTLIEPSIQALNEYKDKTLPTEQTLRGYAQYSGA